MSQRGRRPIPNKRSVRRRRPILSKMSARGLRPTRSKRSVQRRGPVARKMSPRGRGSMSVVGSSARGQMLFVVVKLPAGGYQMTRMKIAAPVWKARSAARVATRHMIVFGWSGWGCMLGEFLTGGGGWW